MFQKREDVSTKVAIPATILTNKFEMKSMDSTRQLFRWVWEFSRLLSWDECKFVDVSQTSLTIPRSNHVKETSDDDNKHKEGG